MVSVNRWSALSWGPWIIQEKAEKRAEKTPISPDTLPVESLNLAFNPRQILLQAGDIWLNPSVLGGMDRISSECENKDQRDFENQVGPQGLIAEKVPNKASIGQSSVERGWDCAKDLLIGRSF